MKIILTNLHKGIIPKGDHTCGAFKFNGYIIVKDTAVSEFTVEGFTDEDDGQLHLHTLSHPIFPTTLSRQVLHSPTKEECAYIAREFTRAGLPIVSIE